ncbi:MAG: hypothetical protein IRY99_02870 [Isosphaeraceae bacterium]|nr:hypothetical protein [Isosphaeraceae bacterium]
MLEGFGPGPAPGPIPEPGPGVVGSPLSVHLPRVVSVNQQVVGLLALPDDDQPVRPILVTLASTAYGDGIMPPQVTLTAVARSAPITLLVRAPGRRVITATPDSPEVLPGETTVVARIAGVTQARILRAVRQRLIEAHLAPPDAVALAIDPEPPQHGPGPQYLISPPAASAIVGQTSGGGRLLSGLDASFEVHIYLREETDLAWREDTLADDGALLDLAHAVIDALQMFWPTPEPEFPGQTPSYYLTQEPIRFAGQDRPVRYRRSHGWIYCSLPFRAQYTPTLDTSDGNV